VKRNLYMIGVILVMGVILSGCDFNININKEGEGEKEDEGVVTNEIKEEDEVEVMDNDEDVVGGEIGYEERIKEAFSEKYDRDISEVNVTVNKQTDDYASGGVSFGGEMGGGWFLAAKESDGSFVIVADGNGVVPCASVEPYDFPVNMVPECYDEASGEVLTF